jgi:hypothetical protein
MRLRPREGTIAPADYWLALGVPAFADLWKALHSLGSIFWIAYRGGRILYSMGCRGRPTTETRYPRNDTVPCSTRRIMFDTSLPTPSRKAMGGYGCLASAPCFPPLFYWAQRTLEFYKQMNGGVKTNAVMSLSYCARQLCKFGEERFARTQKR